MECRTIFLASLCRRVCILDSWFGGIDGSVSSFVFTRFFVAKKASFPTWSIYTAPAAARRTDCW